MIIELKVPTPGESITEVEIGKWNVSDGDMVMKGQEIGEIESDKATLTLSATESGQIKILVPEGERVAVGVVACTIDTSVALENKPAKEPLASELFPEPQEEAIPEPENKTIPKTTLKPEESNIKVTLVARKMMEEYHLSME